MISANRFRAHSKCFFIATILLLAWPAANAAEHMIQVVSNQFIPSELTIEVGDTVTWVNQGGFHNVQSDDQNSGGANVFRCALGCDQTGGNGNASSQLWSASFTFEEAGEVPYNCVVHSNIGMRGTLTVQGTMEDPFNINFGHIGSWFNPETNGQGFNFDVLVNDMGEAETLVAYMFTYDNDIPGMKFDGEDHRWFVAAGPIDGDTANMTLTLTTGGIFDDPTPTTTTVVGSMDFQAHSCTEGTVTINVDQNVDDDDLLMTTIPVVRLSPDVLCEELSAMPAR